MLQHPRQSFFQAGGFRVGQAGHAEEDAVEQILKRLGFGGQPGSVAPGDFPTLRFA